MQQNDTWRRCSPAGLDIQRLHRKPVVFEQSQLYPAACMASSRRTCPRLLLLGGPFGRSHIAAVSRRLIRSSRSAPPQGAAALRRDGGPGSRAAMHPRPGAIDAVHTLKTARVDCL